MNEAEFEIALEAFRLHLQTEGVHVEFKPRRSQSGALLWGIHAPEFAGTVKYRRLPKPVVKVTALVSRLEPIFEQKMREFGFPIADEEEAKTEQHDEPERAPVDPEYEWLLRYTGVSLRDVDDIKDFRAVDYHYKKVAARWKITHKSARERISRLRGRLKDLGIEAERISDILPI